MVEPDESVQKALMACLELKKKEWKEGAFWNRRTHEPAYSTKLKTFL